MLWQRKAALIAGQGKAWLIRGSDVLTGCLNLETEHRPTKVSSDDDHMKSMM